MEVEFVKEEAFKLTQAVLRTWLIVSFMIARG